MQVNRREFVTLLGGAVAAWPVVAHGQQPGMPGDRSPWPHFDKDLAEADFVENRNVAFEFRWADGQFDRLPGLAADLDDRFHESCHKRGIHSLSQTPICAVGALTRRIEKEWQRGGGRLKCRLEMRISRT